MHRVLQLRTLNALQCMSCMSAKSQTGEHAEVTCAAALALFNHRSFVSKLTKACSAQAKKTGKPLQRTDFVTVLEKLIEKTPNKRLFTESFDVAATRNPQPELVQNRLDKVKKFHLKRQQGGLKSNAQGPCVTRKALNLAFGTHFSTLLGRNAYSLLEQHYEKKCKPHGRPGWLQEHGTLMGPGALTGANILAEEVRNYRIQTNCFTDMALNYEASSVAIKRWKRMLRDEIASWSLQRPS